MYIIVFTLIVLRHTKNIHDCIRICFFIMSLTLVFSVFTQMITLSEKPSKDTVELTKDSTHLILTNKLNKQKVVKIKTETFKKVSIVLLENEVKKIPIEKEEGSKQD